MRRRQQLRGYWSDFIILVLAGSLCFVDLWLADTLRLRLFPIPILVALYIGYRWGRWAGLLGGLLAVVPWMLLFGGSDYLDLSDYLYIDGDGWSDLLFQGISYGDGVAVYGVPYAVLAGLAGFVSGVLFDWLDQRLSVIDCSLDDLLPRRERRPALQWAYQRLASWLSPEPRENRGSKDGTGIFSGLLRTKPIQLLPIALLLVVVNFSTTIGDDGLTTQVLPGLVPCVVVLVSAFLTSARLGILLSLVVWPVGLIIAAVGFPELPRQFRSGWNGILGVSDPAQGVGLAILAWWAGTIGEILRDDRRRLKIADLVSGWFRSVGEQEHPSFLLFVILLVATLGFSVTVGDWTWTYKGHVAVFLVLALWGHSYTASRVSNVALFILTILAFVSSELEIVDSFWIATLHPDAVSVVMLAVVPLVAARLDLTDLRCSRILSFGFLLAWTIAALYLDFLSNASYMILLQIPDVSEWTSLMVMLLTWAVQIGVFELIARLLQRQAQTRQ